MRMVTMGRTGVRVSALCFGTMSFGSSADEAASALMYQRCRDAGINHFDTADMYAQGACETILGRLIKGHRHELILASKVYFPMGEDPNARGLSRRHLRAAVEASLKRLGTDYLDLYYLHRFDPHTDLLDTLRGLDQLVREGKLLYPALSNFAAWQVMKALGLCAQHGLMAPVAIQPMYSLVKRQAEVELLPMAQSEALASFPYSPLGAGLLTGKYTGGATPAQGRLVESAQYRARYQSAHHHEVAARFCALAAREGYSPTSLAIAWVAAQPGVTSPIIGARHVGQLDDALASLKIDMTPELLERLSKIAPAPPLATDREEERAG